MSMTEIEIREILNNPKFFFKDFQTEKGGASNMVSFTVSANKWLLENPAVTPINFETVGGTVGHLRLRVWYTGMPKRERKDHEQN
jgi:hypothetical protein